MENNILNYKGVVNVIYIDSDVEFKLNTELCDYEKSKFCIPHFKHIII